MAEQKQQTSHSWVKGIFHFSSRIIRLTWIIFLSLLLAGGLFFQVPWTVTGPLFVFLIAATVLPGAYRKWFWAAAGCAAAIAAVWVFLPEKDEGWQPYTFDKELASLEAKYAISGNENAAAIYNKLIDDDVKDSVFAGLTTSDFAKLPLRDPWSNEKEPGILTWLERHKTTISSLMGASQIAHCRFSFASDIANPDNMDFRLKMMGRWASMLVSAANNDMAEKRVDEGLDKYITVLQIGEHQNQQFSQADFMVGSGIERSSMNQLKRFACVGPVTEEKLDIIEDALAKIESNWSDDLPKMLDYEKLLTKNFWRTYYEVNPSGQTRFARGLAEQLPRGANDGPLTTYWHKSLMKAGSLFYWLYMPLTPNQASEIIDKAYDKLYSMAKPDFNWAEGPKRFSKREFKFNYHYAVALQLHMLEPIYYNIHSAYFRTLAQERGARLVVALRRYKDKNGSWPTKLDDVRPLARDEIFTDPTNGGSFIYRLTDEGFTLYSKGKNNIDEGGNYHSDDWPIWPPIGLKYKIAEEKQMPKNTTVYVTDSRNGNDREETSSGLINRVPEKKYWKLP